VQAQLVSVAKLYANGKAFAALTTAGKVVVWGKVSDGGQIPADKGSALASGVVSISYTDRAFTALKSDGSVVAWGRASYGGSPSAGTMSLLVSGVHTMCANDAAFSAIKTDGKVVAWGHRVSVLTEGVQMMSPHRSAAAQCR
jgi:alpha-tubulin suppressor-like RCC1 family protein